MSLGVLFELSSYETLKNIETQTVILLVSSGITPRPVHRAPPLVGQIQFTELH